VQTLNEATAATNRLLKSSDAKEVAWGAFTAAQYHVTSAIPLLITALQQISSVDADPHGGTELAILDALVHLRAQVPADVLERSLGRWPIPTLILLENATGARDAMLLQRLSVTTAFEWQAIGNLLLRSKPPGLAYQLLEGLQLQLTVYVTDQPNVGFGSGLGRGSDGCMVATAAPGFPPLADYQFATAGPGATILSIGPETVYYVRRTLTPPIIPCQNGGRAEKPRDDDRVKYLNALVRAQVETVPLRQSTSVTVLWSNPDMFRQEVSRHRQAVEEQYQNVISVLVWAKRLTEEESRALTPKITVTVDDQRKNKSEPLPALEDRGGGAVSIRRQNRVSYAIHRDGLSS
jgi:hypothetical protein